MFDADLQLIVWLNYIDPAVSAYMDVRVLGQTPDEGGRMRWKVSGRHDSRLPDVGKNWHEAHWIKDGNKTLLVLETKNRHSWAKLDFPTAPEANSLGLGRAYNLPDGPNKKYKFDGTGAYQLHWSVRAKGKNRVLHDPDEMKGLWQNLKQPTGWVYDTSASGGGGGGWAGVGAAHTQGHLIFRRERNGKSERCRVDFKLTGVGAMLPGAGGSYASEDFTSWGTRVFAPATAPAGDFPPSRFTGGLTAMTVGAGAAAGAGGTRDEFILMFTDGMFGTKMPNIAAVKAFLHCGGYSAAAGKGVSGQALLMAGTATLHKS